MHHLLKFPIPCDITLPSTHILLTHPQRSEQILNLTAVLPEPPLTATPAVSDPPSISPTEIFIPTAPGVPQAIYQLHRRKVLTIAHDQSSITVSLHREALEKCQPQVITLIKFAYESTRCHPTPYTREWAFQAVRRTAADDDIHEYQQYLQLVQQHNTLNVTLRPYQQRAVAWMLSREKTTPQRSFNCRFADFIYDPIAQQVVLADDKERSDDADAATPWEGRGGLLCDEMGLGKTVELMQLVLCNPFTEQLSELPKRQPLVCVVCEADLATQAFTCVECGGGCHAACLPDSHTPNPGSNREIVCVKCKQAMTDCCHESTPVSNIPTSRATLVVVPTTLLRQWVVELQKHVKDSLNIQIFQGTKAGYIPQHKLQVADVVLTTYGALRADYHSACALRTPRARGRYARKYPPSPIPLLSLRWHRVAFDESQMLSMRGSVTAGMAGFLHARYRWCVTGTPMRDLLTSAENMFYMLFLKYHGKPVDWCSLFQPSSYPSDSERLKLLLRSVMWRTSKADIGPDELELPTQNVEFIRTRFGPVETYHYQSLLQNVRSVICRHRTAMNEREMKISRELVTMLRQACTHPRIGVSGRRLLPRGFRALGEGGHRLGARRENAVQKAEKKAENPLDMNDVLKALVMKANLECMDALRSLVASTNGLAAVHLLQFSLLPAHSPVVDGLVKAIQLYRDVLRITDENQHITKLDEIQLMHVLFNLNDAFKSVDTARAALRSAATTERRKGALETLGSLGRTMREGQLMEQMDKLREKYISDARGDLAVISVKYKGIAEKLGDEPLIEAEEKQDEDEDEPEEEVLERVCAEQRRGKSTWWQIALATLLEEDNGEKFLMRIVEKLIEALPGRGLGAKTLANRLSSFYSLAVVISAELRKLQAVRNRLKKQLFELPGSREPTSHEVSESGQCRGCREFGAGPKCRHCRSENLIIDVERHLYSLQEELDEETLESLRYEESDTDDDETYFRGTDPRAIVNSAFIPKSHNSKSAASVSSRIRYVSEVETILKGLAAVVRRKKNPDTIAEMTEWFSRWEELKEELTAARKIFEAQRSYLASLDEVNMALMRLSVLDDGIDVKDLSELEARHRVPRGSLGPLRIQFETEKATAEVEFCKKRGSIVYLRSLQKSTSSQVTGKRTQDVRKEFSNCPVCLFEFDDSLTRIAVMVCGHVFCCDCMLAMIKKIELKRRMEVILCPTCRAESPIDEINFTSTTPQPPRKKCRSEDRSASPSSDSGDVTEFELDSGDRTPPAEQEYRKLETQSSFYDSREEVRGHFGAKVSATVRLIRGIWSSQESSKILIFSEWNEVLSLMAHSLTANGIFFCDGAKTVGAKAFANAVEEFKTCEYTNVILLPLRRAGAGLNLTEARHVILMEPSVNISSEAQAVGRIHRIGQTRTTYVHRVMVNYTIEDKILILGDQFRENKSGEGGSIALNDAIGAIRAREPEVTEPQPSVEAVG